MFIIHPALLSTMSCVWRQPGLYRWKVYWMTFQRDENSHCSCLLQLLSCSDGLNEDAPHGFIFWILGPQLVQLFEKEEKVWPWWRWYFTDGTFWLFQSPLHFQLIFPLFCVNWDVNFQLLLKACLPAYCHAHHHNG